MENLESHQNAFWLKTLHKLAKTHSKIEDSPNPLDYEWGFLIVTS